MGIVIGQIGELNGAVLGNTLLFEKSEYSLLPADPNHGTLTLLSGAIAAGIDATGVLHLNGYINFSVTTDNDANNLFDLPTDWPKNWTIKPTQMFNKSYTPLWAMYSDGTSYSNIWTFEPQITNGVIQKKPGSMEGSGNGKYFVAFPDVQFTKS
ncbi:hypothetical protein LASUN_16350 [Lentilactobacillus sunkii]|jgi:hypothetical protein|uniref:Uncharacterized protein n=1 Tax=Lentilactobacillus sunkii TaxID=481719 RepID=A0A1E7XCJ0_9LACO|nr:hypothetical protein [Lentilactobacillus sunkii]OFA10728.1 hypothetical protein LASUN_16350 [Lentilactobacillus sunkii]